MHTNLLGYNKTKVGENMDFSISEIFKNIVSLMSSFTIFDFLDICLVAFIVYNAIKFIRQTRAFQLVKGIIFLGVVYILVRLLNMQVATYIMSRVFSDAVLLVILLFQPEIRHVLERVGRKRFSSGKGISESEEINNTVTAICKSCSDLSDKKIGALLVLERDTLLGEIINTGNKIDALVTSEMIGNIFYPKAPLHDGAAIIRGSRIISAGCILPLTQNPLSSELGTRHRAAVGMSELSDAVVVVVSEETGGISIAFQGELKRNVSPGELRESLIKYFINENTGNQSFIKKVFGGRKNG